MPRTYLVIPSLSELAQIAAGAHGARNQLPPPGMGLGITARAGWLEDADHWMDNHTPLFVTGSPTEGGPDDWWWATLGDTLAQVLVPESDDWNWFVQKIAQLSSRSLSATLSLPLLKKGSANTTMRWIRSTFRGDLGGGVEQFQFKFDWGNPGDDPDIDAAAAQALAESFASLWWAGWAGSATYPAASAFSSDVAFTEVGVVTLESTSATDVDGGGGNLEYKYGTEWWAYPVGSRPVGAGGMSLPYEVACAVSLQTDTRGARGRGRAFMPPPGTSAMATGGVFNTTYVNQIGNYVADFLNRASESSGFVPVVVSRRALQLHQITSVNVGKVPDSQRRRRRSQDEARIVTLLAA